MASVCHPGQARWGPLPALFLAQLEPGTESSRNGTWSTEVDPWAEAARLRRGVAQLEAEGLLGEVEPQTLDPREAVGSQEEEDHQTQVGTLVIRDRHGRLEEDHHRADHRTEEAAGAKPRGPMAGTPWTPPSSQCSASWRTSNNAR